MLSNVHFKLRKYKSTPTHTFCCSLLSLYHFASLISSLYMSCWLQSPPSRPLRGSWKRHNEAGKQDHAEGGGPITHQRINTVTETITIECYYSSMAWGGVKTHTHTKGGQHMTQYSTKLFSAKLTIRTGEWYLRTLYRRFTDAKEMDRYNIKILGLSEGLWTI